MITITRSPSSAEPRAVVDFSCEGTVADARAAWYDAPVRPTVHMSIALDTSGSMRPHEESLRTACSALVRLLPTDSSTVRIVTFNSEASEFVPRTHLSLVTQDAISEKVKTIVVSDRRTNIYDGLMMVTNDMSSLQGKHVLVVLSDGVANESITGTYAILSSLTLPRFTTAICIGFAHPLDLQMDLLTGIAKMTDGHLHTPQSQTALQESFGDIAGDIISSMVFVESDVGNFFVRLGSPRHIPVLKSLLPMTYKATHMITGQVMEGTMTYPATENDIEAQHSLLLHDGMDALVSRTYGSDASEFLERIEEFITRRPSPQLENLRALLCRDLTQNEMDRAMFELAHERSGIDSAMHYEPSQSQRVARQASASGGNTSVMSNCFRILSQTME